MGDLTSHNLAPEQASATRASQNIRRFFFILKRIPGGAAKQLSMIFLMLLILYPLFFIFNNALKTRDEYLGNQVALPANPTFQNFMKVIQYPHLLNWFANSLILTLYRLAYARSSQYWLPTRSPTCSFQDGIRCLT